jgi:hypothetical protein
MAAKTPIDDLEYELRLLLGAAKIITALESKQSDVVGNNINYFKDSGYLHVRNLYNFFSGGAVHDGSVHEYTTHNFNLTLYLQWKSPLHRHVLHISGKRNNANNEINGVHINTKLPDFATDTEALWQEWINVTTNTTEQQNLKDALTRAQKEAQDDCDQFIKLIDKGSQ